MTNIKNNKLFSSQSCSGVAAKNVPLFINPNGSGSFAQPIVANAAIANATTIAGLPAKLIQPKPKLVFLQKKRKSNS